jgi:hypothetical protein
MQSVKTHFEHNISKDMPATIALEGSPNKQRLLSDAGRQQINQSTNIS